MSLITRTMAALVLAFAFATAALADEATGKIASIDIENLLIVLEDGTRFAIPEEFYVDDLVPGMSVVIQFDVIDGAKMINDLEIEG